ncbi:hypothetical protein HK100_012619 [Physocladia obscura]|uniref:NADH:flavin oxidoreductase/NADH oxidase N-terminal domain-containing protein n=1 Tax=Physocladia obscura TaxID=109957 RepID=A0AAD5XKH8_9FUNG|nr:hypothetical protein HK100_012619 [Physocladia obscura]
MTTQSKYPLLFSPLKVGDMQLAHRIVLAPLTRSRSPNYIANVHNALYYAQRTTPGGLLVSEGTTIDPTANGYPDVPALYTKEHALGTSATSPFLVQSTELNFAFKAWTTTTEAVHNKKGFIYAQLWHVGRLSQPKFQPNNQLQVSSSATSARRNRALARALTVPEIKELVNAYANSAKLAIEVAGFDGVEIHAAHGYLIEQFLNDNSNLRTDHYGGSIENRSRFLFEILDAILAVVPTSKVAIRISPECNMQGMKDSNPVALYTYVLSRLNKYNLSYIQLTEPVWGMWLPGPKHSESKLNSYRKLLNNHNTKVMLTGGYTGDIAEEALQAGRGDFIGIGRDFITNPDIVDRLRFGKAVTQYDNAGSGYYTGGKHLYTDYPTWLEQESEKFLSKSRSPNFVANALNALYYAQRATPGGLLISEGTTIDPTANGYPNVPAIYTEEHALGWRASTDAVHRKGGFIYAQLWHVGRLSQPKFQPDNQLPVSSSATTAREGREAARALTVAEIKDIVKAYAHSAKLAIEVAGFDGVEIHAAHGYLIEQFLTDNTNFRTDEYGGSIENRARFLFEIVDSVVAAVLASKVAIRISPECDMQGVKDSDPVHLYSYVLGGLDKYNLSYIHLTEPVWGSWGEGPKHSESKLNKYQSLNKNKYTKIILTGGYTGDIAEEALEQNRGDLIGFGRDFITNPDLVYRIKFNKYIAKYGNAAKGFYGSSKEQYTDYPTWEEQEAVEFLAK